MKPQRRPEEILRAWGRSAIEQESGRRAEHRDRAVARIAQHITLAAEQRRRTVRFRLRAAVLCAAAAVFALVLGASGLFRSGPASQTSEVAALAGELRGSDRVIIERSGVRRPAHESMALAPGDEVHAQAGARTEVTLTGGAAVEVRPESRLVLGRSGGSDSLELLVGELTVNVPKLEGSRTFSVRTPDARVVVHGTRFVVSVLDAQAKPRTRVRVLEGRVGVEHQGVIAELMPGQSWPVAQQPASPPDPASGEAAAPPAKPSRPTGSGPSSSAASRKSPAPVSEAALAEQNRMFAAAVAASRRGDDARAVALIDELLARYPSSPLLPEARVERFRALKRLGRQSEAAREASRYLLENDHGAARDEAREVVLPDPK